jgi:hypothetical protein
MVVKDVAKNLKGSSSHYLNKETDLGEVLYWQNGYGVITIREEEIPKRQNISKIKKNTTKRGIYLRSSKNWQNKIQSHFSLSGNNFTLMSCSPVVRNHRLFVRNPHSGFYRLSHRILSDGESSPVVGNHRLSIRNPHSGFYRISHGFYPMARVRRWLETIGYPFETRKAGFTGLAQSTDY